MMSPMLSREGHVTCQNEHHLRRVGNSELEILECHTVTIMPAHQDQPNAQNLKKFAQLLKKQGLGESFSPMGLEN